MSNREMLDEMKKGADVESLIAVDVQQLKKEGSMEDIPAAEYAYALGTYQAKLAAALDHILYLENQLNKKRK
jgi:hypothetical protein